MFRSKNWDLVKSHGITCRVMYTEADLELSRTNITVYDAKTTIVVLVSGDCRYVGVAQCGPRDEYNKFRGREIAAGRALKQLNKHILDDNAQPNEVWDGVSIYGIIPAGFEVDNIFEQIIKGSRE